MIREEQVSLSQPRSDYRRWWSAGPEMTLAGVIVGGATYLVGLAFPT